MKPYTYSREEIETAMDAFDEYRESGHSIGVFEIFQNSRDYWVHSTRERQNNIYPTKPIVGFLRKQKGLGIVHNGGWSQKSSAATVLYNSGFIIVNKNDKPVRPPKEKKNFIRDADFIRLCARNYFNERARERGDQEVKICARTLSRRIGLHRTYDVQNALKSPNKRPIDVPVPATRAGPRDSGNTMIFTYQVTQLASPPANRSKALLEVFRAKTKDLPKKTEEERLVRQRIGQDIFRLELIVHWEGKCPLTGITDQPLLRASHIKPWKDCMSDAERLDVHNGLLLSALWDLAFDQGFVTFEDNGEPKFSKALSKTARAALRWKTPIRLTPEHKKRLAWHRDKVFDRKQS